MGTRDERQKASNPEMNAKQIREYAAAFRARCQQLHETIAAAADELEFHDPEMTIRPLTASVERYLCLLEERVTAQFGENVKVQIRRRKG